MIINKRGFVLITVLLFLAIFTLWTFYALETDVLENTFSDQFFTRNLASMAADAILASLEKKGVVNDTKCRISKTDSHELMMNREDWWRRVSCAGIFNSFQYYYVIETLASNSCSYIDQEAKEGKKKISVDYHRVSLYLTSPRNGKQKVLVQTVIAEPLDKEIECSGSAHRVFSGRQSWRELI